MLGVIPTFFPPQRENFRVAKVTSSPVFGTETADFAGLVLATVTEIARNSILRKLF